MESYKIVCCECSEVNSIEGSKELYSCHKCKADLEYPFALEVDDALCKKHIEENDIVVIVDFFSPLCGPCMAMYDAYEDAALAFGMTVRFLKINADEHQEIAQKYQVGALPTLIAFQGREELGRVSRALTQVELTLWAESLLDTH